MMPRGLMFWLWSSDYKVISVLQLQSEDGQEAEDVINEISEKEVYILE